ncbi:MAG TPA: DUF427 domain-containing protein [Caulobacteraceae bacterium]|jgi:uncharacterized protein (DUF427 family)|nr:DUF427 domain-containing protein [Caulobacteraceae bacterium]
MFKAPAIFEPMDRRIRLRLNDDVVADSDRAMMLISPGRHPVYYLPKADFAAGALLPSAAAPDRIWSLHAGRVTLEGVAAAFEGDAHGLAPMADHLTVAWDAVRWFEEDEEILRHPRNPYVRVDCIHSSRRVQVVLDGQVVADTRRAVFLFETGHVTRHYMPIEDVRPGILRPSALRTYCPYKGEAGYRSVELAGRVHDNVVWSYDGPYDECLKIKGLVAFYNEKVDAVLVDGKPASGRFPPRI